VIYWKEHMTGVRNPRLSHSIAVRLWQSLISLSLFPQLQNGNNTSNTCSMCSRRLTAKATLRQLYANVFYTPKNMVIAIITDGKNKELEKNQSLCF
jgi:hypothetical protein